MKTMEERQKQEDKVRKTEPDIDRKDKGHLCSEKELIVI